MSIKEKDMFRLQINDSEPRVKSYDKEIWLKASRGDDFVVPCILVFPFLKKEQ